MSSKPIFGHSYVLMNIIIPFYARCVAHGWPIQSKGHAEVGDSPSCMNEGKPDLTFQSIYTRENVCFMMMFCMAWIFRDVLFIAEAITT